MWAPGHLCPNLEVTLSHRSPKGLWEKSQPAVGVPSRQGEPHPFRVASAGHYFIPHGSARAPGQQIALQICFLLPQRQTESSKPAERQ